MASKKKIASLRTPEVEMWMERFEWAYRQSTNDLVRLQDFQNMYDNIVDPSRWATTAKLPIPLMFSMVEKAIPDAFFYMFPPGNFLNLIPMERGIDIEHIENAELALHQTLMYRMRFPWYAIPTLKDCYKLGVGYGAVEPIVVTPPAAFINTAKTGDTTVRARTIGFGKPRLGIRYAHVSPGEIIVSQDGSDFNGPHRVSHAFRVHSYTEQQFLNMYSDAKLDGEKPELEGSAKKIVAEARSLGFSSRTGMADIVRALGGHDITNQEKDKRIPCRVPILKIYTPHEHVWIANGTTIIYRSSEKYQTLHTPLVKCSAWPDGDRWYPMSAVEASQGMAIGTNLWINMILDTMVQVSRPTMVYDKTLTGNRPPERGPNGEIGLGGSVKDSIHYLENPRMDAGVFSVGDLLMRWYGSATGQEAFLDRPSPGMVRGGMFAFESLLQSTTGRQKMAGAILDMGFVEPVARQTLLQLQLNITDGPEMYPLREYDSKTGKSKIKYIDVTEEDLVNAFELSVDLREKMASSAMESQQRQAEFDRLNGDEYVDQWELRNRLLGQSVGAQRMLFSRERVSEIQEERRQAELQATAAGASQSAPALPSTTTTEQAAQGAGIA